MKVEDEVVVHVCIEPMLKANIQTMGVEACLASLGSLCRAQTEFVHLSPTSFC